MYNSFAIWHEKRDEQAETLSTELHLNLWQFSSQKNDSLDCLDIGIKIEKISNFSSINLFVPFVLKKDGVLDLGETITKNNKLLTAIFNECTSVETNNSKLVKITLRKEGGKSSHKSLNVYIVDTANNIALKEEEENESGKTKIVGTTIKIDLSKINDNDSGTIPIYLRIRINFPSQDVSGKILHEHVPKDSWLQSSMAKKQFVDFRLNEKRNLPKTIQEKCVDKFIKIKKIHFFLMREFADGLIMSDPDTSGYRVLESDTWSDYFDQKHQLQLNHMIAYHWKVCSLEENSFKLSTKFSFQESSNWKILVFILMSLFLGAVGGVAGNLVTRLIDGSENSVEKIEQSELKSIDSTVETDLLEKNSGTDEN